MAFYDLTHIVQSINITILPIIIIPVTVLCCLTFYNRIGQVFATIHGSQKELRGLLLEDASHISIERKEELIHATRLEQQKLIERADILRAAIFSCFSGLIAFILSALSIIAGFFSTYAIFFTLGLWILGAILFVVGLLVGIFEIKSFSLRSITFQTALLEKWIAAEKGGHF